MEKTTPTDDILTKINHCDGMTVPEGYFADFKHRMAMQLPTTDFERGESANPAPRTWWQRTRPYVYMAAMFAGVWCMMKMVDMTRQDAGLNIEAHPAVAAAIHNDEFFQDFVVSSVDDQTIYDELYDEGFDTTDFE